MMAMMSTSSGTDDRRALLYDATAMITSLHTMRCLLLTLLLGCSLLTANASTIYRYVDRDGHVTFTNLPLPGAQAIMVTPANTDGSTGSTPTPRQSKPRSPAASINVPAIDAGTQRNRDEGRRRILQTELDNEQKALAEARQALAEARRKPGTPAPQLQRLQDAVTDRERNVGALNQELGGQSALK